MFSAYRGLKSTGWHGMGWFWVAVLCARGYVYCDCSDIISSVPAHVFIPSCWHVSIICSLVQSQNVLEYSLGRPANEGTQWINFCISQCSGAMFWLHQRLPDCGSSFLQDFQCGVAESATTVVDCVPTTPHRKNCEVYADAVSCAILEHGCIVYDILGFPYKGSTWIFPHLRKLRLWEEAYFNRGS